jgi:hypothetical protein
MIMGREGKRVLVIEKSREMFGLVNHAILVYVLYVHYRPVQLWSIMST